MKVNVENLRNEHQYKEMELPEPGSNLALFFFSPFFQGVNTEGIRRDKGIQNYHLKNGRSYFAIIKEICLLDDRVIQLCFQ